MGIKDRLKRRAARKEKRADNKEKRAAKLAVKDREKRGSRREKRGSRREKRIAHLLEKAKKLDARAAELKAKAKIVVGAEAKLYSVNSVDSCHIKVTWTTDGAKYDKFKVLISSSSVFRSQRRQRTVDGPKTSYDSKTEGDAGRVLNIRYTVRVLGYARGTEKMIGRCIAKKIK